MKIRQNQDQKRDFELFIEDLETMFQVLKLKFQKIGEVQ